MPSPRWRRRKQGEVFGLPLNMRKGPPPGPEILPWYWNPDRDGVKQPPAAVVRQLRELDPDLRAVFSPVHERYLIWLKSDRIQNALCKGWLLLFIWEDPTTKEYLELGDPPTLLFHNLYLIAAHRFPNAKGYYDTIQKSIEAKKAEREKDYQNGRRDMQRDYYSSYKISTAAPGNRAALHHSGTIVPSPGEQAWRTETRKWRIPSEQVKQEAADKEKAFY